MNQLENLEAKLQELEKRKETYSDFFNEKYSNKKFWWEKLQETLEEIENLEDEIIYNEIREDENKK